MLNGFFNYALGIFENGDVSLNRKGFNSLRLCESHRGVRRRLVVEVVYGNTSPERRQQFDNRSSNSSRSAGDQRDLIGQTQSIDLQSGALPFLI